MRALIALVLIALGACAFTLDWLPIEIRDHLPEQIQNRSNRSLVWLGGGVAILLGLGLFPQ